MSERHTVPLTLYAFDDEGGKFTQDVDLDGPQYGHRDDPDCWCRPTKTYTDPATGTEVWVHRYADD